MQDLGGTTINPIDHYGLHYEENMIIHLYTSPF